MTYSKKDLDKMALGVVPQEGWSAMAWLRILEKSEASYHIDDDPREVVNLLSGGRERSFTDDAAEHLEACLEACSRHLGSWTRVWEVYYPVRDEE